VTSTNPRAAGEIARLLAAPARRFDIELSERVCSALATFASLLLDWNQRINLTGARDLPTLAAEHLADAFALAPHLPATGRCVDVGSGAGLPGVVLAVLRPDLDFVLLEPIQKRRAFLLAAVRALSLGNVTVSEERLQPHALRHARAYDFAVARAVLPLDQWLAEGGALVKEGGALAGLAAGSVRGVPRDAVLHSYDVGAGPRTVVLVRKASVDVPRGTEPGTW